MADELLSDLLSDYTIVNKFKALKNRSISDTSINIKLVEDPLTQKKEFVSST